MNTYEHAIQTIENTADYYHAMILEADDTYRIAQFETALDLLERIQNLEENSLAEKHLQGCESCQELLGL